MKNVFGTIYKFIKWIKKMKESEKISKLMNNDVSDIIDEYENFTFDFNIDMEMVIDEALKYDKINESKIFIDKKVLQEALV